MFLHIGIAFSTVNRWEGGKSKPNMTEMKKINLAMSAGKIFIRQSVV